MSEEIFNCKKKVGDSSVEIDKNRFPSSAHNSVIKCLCFNGKLNDYNYHLRWEKPTILAIRNAHQQPFGIIFIDKNSSRRNFSIFSVFYF